MALEEEQEATTKTGTPRKSYAISQRPSIRELQQQLLSTENRKPKTVPPGHYVGKIGKDDWNVKQLEERLKVLEKGERVEKKQVERPQVFEEIFKDKRAMMDARLKGAGPERAKYGVIDEKLQKVERQLKDGGAVLDVGERGRNKVAQLKNMLDGKGVKNEPVVPLNPPKVNKYLRKDYNKERHGESSSSASCEDLVASGSGVEDAPSSGSSPPVQESSDLCYFCGERVYLIDRLSAEGHFFHRSCLRCEYCGINLRIGSYAYDSSGVCKGKFFCVAHFRLEKPSERWTQMMMRKAAFLQEDPKPAQLLPKKEEKIEVEVPFVTVDSGSSPEVLTPQRLTPDQAALRPGISSSLIDINRDRTPERAEFENLGDTSEMDQDELLNSELEEEELTQRNLGATEVQTDDDFDDLSTDEDEDEMIAAVQVADNDELHRSLTADATRHLAETWSKKHNQSCQSSSETTDEDSSTEKDEGATTDDVDSDYEYGSDSAHGAHLSKSQNHTDSNSGTTTTQDEISDVTSESAWDSDSTLSDSRPVPPQYLPAPDTPPPTHRDAFITKPIPLTPPPQIRHVNNAYGRPTNAPSSNGRIETSPGVLKPLHLHTPVMYRQIPMAHEKCNRLSSTSMTDLAKREYFPPVPPRKASLQPIRGLSSDRGNMSKVASLSTGSLFNHRPGKDSGMVLSEMKARRAENEKLKFLGDFDQLLNAKGGLLESCDRFLTSVTQMDRSAERNSQERGRPSNSFLFGDGPPVPSRKHPRSPMKPLLTPQPQRPAYTRSMSDSYSADNSPAMPRYRAVSENRYQQSNGSNESLSSPTITRPFMRKSSVDSAIAERYKRNSLVNDMDRSNSIESISEGGFLRRAFGDRDQGARVRNSPFRKSSCDLPVNDVSVPPTPPRRLSVSSQTSRSDRSPSLQRSPSRHRSPTRLQSFPDVSMLSSPMVIPKASLRNSPSKAPSYNVTYRGGSREKMERVPSKKSIKYGEDFVEPAKATKIKIFDANFEGISDKSSSDLSADWTYPNSESLSDDSEPELKRLVGQPTKSKLEKLLRNKPDLSDNLRSASVNSALNELNATFKEMEVTGGKKKKGHNSSESSCVLC